MFSFKAQRRDPNARYRCGAACVRRPKLQRKRSRCWCHSSIAPFSTRRHSRLLSHFTSPTRYTGIIAAATPRLEMTCFCILVVSPSSVCTPRSKLRYFRLTGSLSERRTPRGLEIGDLFAPLVPSRRELNRCARTPLVGSGRPQCDFSCRHLSGACAGFL